MPSDYVKVDEAIVKRVENSRKKDLSDAGVYSSISDKFKDPANIRVSNEAIHSVNAVERCLTVYSLLRDKLEKHFSSNGGVDKKVSSFINNYALYCGASEGMNYITAVMPYEIRGLSNVPINYSNGSLTADLVRLYQRGTMNTKINSPEKLLQFTKALFSGIVNQVNENKDSYDGIVDAVSKLNVQVYGDGLIFRGFSTTSYGKNNIISTATSLDDIVGVDNILEQLRCIASQVASYDVEEQKNPILSKNINSRIMLYGPPGVGKGTIIKAFRRLLKEEADKTGTPFEATSYTNADKSKWWGDSEKSLREKMSVLTDPKCIGFFDVQDADTVFENRYMKDASQTENKLLGQFLHEIDELIDYYEVNGCSGVAIIDTNNPESIDPAESRRFHKIKIEPITTAEDHLKLFGIKTRDYKNNINATKEEIWRFAELCGKCGFNGSDLNDIIERSLGYTLGYIPLEIRKLPYDEKVKAIEKLYTQVGIDKFVEKAKEHLGTKRDIRSQGNMKEIMRRAKELLIDLKARDKVSEELGGK